MRVPALRLRRCCRVGKRQRTHLTKITPSLRPSAPDADARGLFRLPFGREAGLLRGRRRAPLTRSREGRRQSQRAPWRTEPFTALTQSPLTQAVSRRAEIETGAGATFADGGCGFAYPPYGYACFIMRVPALRLRRCCRVGKRQRTHLTKITPSLRPSAPDADARGLFRLPFGREAGLLRGRRRAPLTRSREGRRQSQRAPWRTEPFTALTQSPLTQAVSRRAEIETGAGATFADGGCGFAYPPYGYAGFIRRVRSP